MRLAMTQGFDNTHTQLVARLRLVNAQQKLDALEFWNKHGLDVTRDAYKVSSSTLYPWRKSHCEGAMSGLHDRSRAPRQRRRRSWPPALRAEIRRLRTDFPNMGKDKLHVLL